MTNKWSKIVFVTTVIFMLSCNLITAPTAQAPAAVEAPINVDTAVARTRTFNFAVQTAAAANQTGPAAPVVPATSQPPAPTTEPTSGPPMISASVNTNCRKGPSTVYEIIGYLLVGQTSEVVNKYLNGIWWVIKSPSNPNQRCWVQGATTNVTGNWQQLAEATVPPTPTIELSLSAAIVSLVPPAWVGPCPIPLNGAGTITANMPVTVTYVWERSAGPNLGSGSLTFTAAGTKTVAFSMNFLSTSSDTVHIHVTSPVDVVSGSLPYNIICMP